MEPANPDGYRFDIIEIAQHLAKVNRFQGATNVPYSVAEHSVRVSWELPDELAMAGLLHDAAEAYICDVSGPLKKLPEFEGYMRIEAKLTKVIGEWFSVELEPMHPDVHHVDLVLLATEKRDLMSREPKPWRPLPEPLKQRIIPWSWQDAYSEFINRYNEIKPRHLKMLAMKGK